MDAGPGGKYQGNNNATEEEQNNQRGQFYQRTENNVTLFAGGFECRLGCSHSLLDFDTADKYRVRRT